MKNRDAYLRQLILFRDKSPIKVITGVRRCGKSTLLDLFEQYLLDDGVFMESIIRMNFESLDFDDIKNYKDLHKRVRERLDHSATRAMNYVLLDEVQCVAEWEKAVNSLRLLPNTDIYITGSNAHLLASELSTLLSGRYVEIKMLPLSFKEYLDFNDYGVGGDIAEHFNQYLTYGAFPGVTEIREHKETIRPFLSGIYNTILIKDVVSRGTVRDPALLDSVMRFLCANIGNPVSVKSVSDYLTSAGRKTAGDTIDNYLALLESAFILYKARRFDVRGKAHLKTQGKYYLVDTGIRNELLGFRGHDYGAELENVVYFELLRRGFDVSIGKVGALEVDFVATKPDKVLYCQVTASMLDERTRERELAPLRGIADNYEKIVLSMDKTPYTDFDGVLNVNLLDFLLSA
ncbi:ATPase [Synergistales bacterium]|nr:ATPase [Synergistales bacterium]